MNEGEDIIDEECDMMLKVKVCGVWRMCYPLQNWDVASILLMGNAVANDDTRLSILILQVQRSNMYPRWSMCCVRERCAS